jgi:hypothetical protein
MKILSAMTAACLSLAASPAFAHRFNVALILPSSSIADEQFRKGFMLATTERDAHADEESDGHLGGLDVYVTILDAQSGDVSGIDIMVVAGLPSTTSVASRTLNQTALLALGQSPFQAPETPEVARFKTAYETTYAETATANAAQGYNAAQRIEVAVRSQGGTDDKAALLRSFDETARDFNW